jgi:cytochrome c551/c552
MSTRIAPPVGRRLAAIAAAAAAALLAGTAGPAAAQARAPAGSPGGARAVSGGTWGTAIEVPGIAALNTGGAALIEQMSCPSAGTCAAGGWYTDSTGATQVFLVSEVHGTWGKAKEIPGTAALNAGGGADVGSVSCATAGNCSVGGNYRDSTHRVQAFVINEVNGTWGKAQEIPGTAALNQGGSAEVISMSCATAGNCSAGGYYAPVNFGAQAFVVSEVHGTWGKAREVPGIAALSTVPAGQVSSVSCASAGNCSAGGFYSDNSGQQAFVVTQTSGTWGKAKEVPGTAALNQGGSAEVNSVSCAAAGGCSAGGSYYDGSGHQQSFVASQANGTWGKAREVPGTAALNQGGMSAGVASVSCPAAGTCSAGGSYTDSSGHQQAFVASQANGIWGKAREVPGTAALNKGNTGIGPVSCASAGNCDAGGTYVDGSGHLQVFVASEVHGTWGKAEEIPGTAALNQGGDAVIGSLSCAPAGTCSAGGQYAPGSGVEAFVVNKT